MSGRWATSCLNLEMKGVGNRLIRGALAVTLCSRGRWVNNHRL
jgi:hypothetical protein